ncbi:terminase small subunit [Turicibacter sanguinis]|nr:terminase small subunit [Turicibacter sanguinis]MTN85274.1 terminase small subunit [Turicibacter sanguinis]MTN88095.1 terminase small subunit [Turicibacter sanguinis]MTN90949.1 terminase small subunit [Turicibacter sanguinis]MTN93778.1 terminase small subunit [Turicibacter sanguinis]
MKLTPKQQAFADYYIQSGNATESYKKAYESCKKEETARANASRMLTNANVVAYIEEKQKEIDSTRTADMKEVKEFWSRTMRDVGNTMKDRLKASELIARTSGAFLEKVEVKGEVKTTNPYEKLTEEELKRLAGIE